MVSHGCKMDQNFRVPRQVGEPLIYKTIHWAFLDGVSRACKICAAMEGSFFHQKNIFSSSKQVLDQE